MEKIRVWILLGGGLALGGGAWILWYAIPDGDWVAIAVTALFLIGVLGSVYGMWCYRRWALLLSRVLAGVAFLFGCYASHFAWTFWLFQEPTLKDRIFAVLQPQISLFLVGPILWMILSVLPSVKEKFHPSRQSK